MVLANRHRPKHPGFLLLSLSPGQFLHQFPPRFSRFSVWIPASAARQRREIPQDLRAALEAVRQIPGGTAAPLQKIGRRTRNK
jgi:hypothetical protein